MPLPAEKDDHEPRGQNDFLKPDPQIFLADSMPKWKALEILDQKNSDKSTERKTVTRTAAEALSAEYTNEQFGHLRRSPFLSKNRSAEGQKDAKAESPKKQAGDNPAVAVKPEQVTKPADPEKPVGPDKRAEEKPSAIEKMPVNEKPSVADKPAEATASEKVADKKPKDKDVIRASSTTPEPDSSAKKSLPELVIEDKASKSAGNLDFTSMLPVIKDAGSRAARELGSWVDQLSAKANELSESLKKIPQSITAPDGGAWKSSDGNWSYVDKSGKTVEKYDAKVDGVTRHENGGTTVNLADGRSIKENSDGSTFEYNANQKLSSIKYKDGSTRSFEWSGDDLVKMTSKLGEWTRVKDDKGSVKDQWLPKGTSTPWSGEINIDQKSGELKIAGNTYRSDSSIEKTNADGTREIKYANSDTVKFDKEGRLSEIQTQDAKRIFSWTTNPSATGENDKQALSAIQVIKDGKNYFHTRQSDGSWNVQTYENNAWSASQSEKISFAANNKTGEYSYEEDGAKHVLSPGKGEKETKPDGTVLEYQGSQIVKATQGTNVREFEWKDKQIVSVKDSAKNTSWSSIDGKWQSDKGDKLPGKASIDDNGSLIVKDGNKSSVIKLDGTQYQRIENAAEKSTVDISKDKVQVKAGDGSTREFKLDEKGEVVQETVLRNSTRESWTRGEKKTDGSYVWTNDQDAAKTEIRSSVTQNDGQLKISYPDGKQYQADTNGEEALENKKQDWSIKYKNGQPSESKFPDGTVRKYTFDKPGESPKTVEVTNKDGSVVNISRESEGVYNYKTKTSEMKWNVNFTVSRDGTYKFVDKDEKNKVTTRTIDGSKTVEDPANKSVVESYRDSVRRVVKDGKSVELVKDEKNQLNELRDSANNASYKRNQSGEWVASAIDSSKPFKDDGLARKGEISISEKGAVSFSDSDGRLVRQELGEKGKLISSKESTVEATHQNTAMSDADKAALEQTILNYAKDASVSSIAKSVFQESLSNFAKRTDISEKEKAATYKEISRLLDSKNEVIFSAADKSLLAAQLSWHIGNCVKNAQGENPTCQVTSLRGQLLYESPSNFARMMTDVLTTGQFKTNDGSIIKPPANSMKRTEGSEESRFPPEDGVRTWLGKISDITVANIHWQRQTVAPSGEVVPKGQLVYRQEPPTGRKDGGHRLYKEPNNGYIYPQNNSDGKLIEQPTMYAKDIAATYNQIVPSNKSNPVVVVERADIKGGAGVSSVQTEDQLHELLSKEPGTHITQIWTGADWCWREPARKYNFKPKDESDGEHALIIKDYDPKTKTVAVDNSWSSLYDRVDGSRRISLHELYLAMAKK